MIKLDFLQVRWRSSVDIEFEPKQIEAHLEELMSLELKNIRKLSAYKGSVGRAAALATILFLSGTDAVGATDFEQGLDAFQSGDFQQALETWLPLAQAGDADSQNALGMMYEYGHGLKRDDAEAARWYAKAAAHGISDAQYRLGVFYENGWGVGQDAKLAVHWYERAAQLGHAFAQHDLAFMYHLGTGVQRDRIQAYKWLKIASVQRPDVMVKHLLTVSKTLTSDEIREAEKLASAWLNAQDI